MNILFTCAGRRVALLDTFRKAMAELGVAGKLFTTDMTSASPAIYKADVGLTVPPVGRLEYIPALLDIVKAHKIDLLVPLTDVDLRSLARQRARFADLGCTVMIGSEEAITLCRDKARINQVLEQAGLATINTYTVAEFRARPFYPCFIKPIRGSASIGTAIIRNDKELHAHLSTYGELMLIQEYVPGQEFTVDVYRSRDGQVRCIVPRQRLQVRSGEVEKGITVRDEELMQAGVKMANLLGDIWGVFCLQCRREEQPGSPPRFFEVNPRFGGGAPLSIAAGANLPLYLLQEVLGLPITAQIGNFTDGLLMLRYDEAVFVKADDRRTLPGYSTPSFR